VAGIKEALGTDSNPRAGKGEDDHGPEIGPKPGIGPDLHARALGDRDVHAVGAALGIDPRTHDEPRARCEGEMRRRKVAARLRVEQESRMLRVPVAKTPAIEGLNRLQAQACRERGQKGVRRARTGLLPGSRLTFLKAEGDEPVGRVIGRKADSHAITRDHADTETAHTARKLGGHLLVIFQGDLVAAATENFVDAAGRLNKVVTSQIESVLPFERTPVVDATIGMRSSHRRAATRERAGAHRGARTLARGRWRG
jgi:hypothetical protein